MMRFIPALTITFTALLFIAWMAVHTPRSRAVFADHPPAMNAATLPAPNARG
jgi:hypothetical protein